MRRRLIITLLVFAWGIMSYADTPASQSQRTTVVKTHIKGLPDGTCLELYPIIFQNVKPLATSVVKSGNAVFRWNATEMMGVCIRVKGSFGRLYCIAQPGKTLSISAATKKDNDVTFGKDIFYDVVTKDSLTSLFYTKLRTRDSVYAKYSMHHKKYSALLKSMSEAYEKTDKTEFNKLRSSAEYQRMHAEEAELGRYTTKTYNALFYRNRNTFWGPLLMSSILISFSESQREYYDMLSTAAKQTYHGRMLKKMLEK